MRTVTTGALLAILVLLACGNDNPTGPGKELVGTWVLISDSTQDITGLHVVYVIRADGTGTQTVTATVEGEDGEISFKFEVTWEIVGNKLISFITGFGETETYSEGYTVRGNRLILVDDDDGSVETWERQ